MNNLPYKNNEVQIQQLIRLLNSLSPSDDTYQYLMNELLIQVYTSYENFLKALLTHLFSDAKKNYRYSPFLVEHNLWKVTDNPHSSYIVPKGQLEPLLKNFPLLKNSYFNSELNAIDTLVIERNSFAHTGTHKATLEQILTAYVTSQYIIKYLEFFYINSNTEDLVQLENIQEFLKNSNSHMKKCLKKINGDTIPENMTAFEKYIPTIKLLKENDYFKMYPEMKNLFTNHTFSFIEDCKGMIISEFKKQLDDFENSFYLAAFRVKDKNNLTAKIILDTFFL